MQDILYVFGGFNVEENCYLDTIELINLNRWAQVKDWQLFVTKAFTARAYPCVAKLTDEILLICGGKADSEELTDILLFDSKVNTT